MDIMDISEPTENEITGKELILNSGKTVLYKMKKSSKFTITVVEWILLFENARSPAGSTSEDARTVATQPERLHSVRIEHHRFSGRKRIFLDNTCVKEQTDFLDVGLEFSLEIDGLPATIDIYTNSIDFYYIFILDGREL